MAALGNGTDDEDQSKFHPHPIGNPPGTLNTKSKTRDLMLKIKASVADSAEIDIEEEEK
jgi:hypothetical protein